MKKHRCTRVFVSGYQVDEFITNWIAWLLYHSITHPNQALFVDGHCFKEGHVGKGRCVVLSSMLRNS